MFSRWSTTALGMLILVGLGACASTSSVRYLNLESRSDDLPFTHTIVSGDAIYIAGTLGIDPSTRRPPEDPQEEARLALNSIRAKLALAGATMSDLVSVQIFCSDLSLYAKFNEVYATYFTDGKYPVRSFIGSGPLLAGARFEINGIAAQP